MSTTGAQPFVVPALGALCVDPRNASNLSLDDLSCRRVAPAQLKWPVANLVVAAAYFGLGWLVSMFFAAYGLFPAPIWLPTAIAMVAAIAGEWRVLPGIFAGSFVANAVLFAPAVHVTTIISLTNALGPVIGAIAARAGGSLLTTFAARSGSFAARLCSARRSARQAGRLRWRSARPSPGSSFIRPGSPGGCATAAGRSICSRSCCGSAWATRPTILARNGLRPAVFVDLGDRAARSA